MGVGQRLQGYLAHKKQPPSLGPPYGPRHIPAVGPEGGAVIHERGTSISHPSIVKLTITTMIDEAGIDQGSGDNPGIDFPSFQVTLVGCTGELRA